MKAGYRVIGISLVFGMLVVVAHAIFDYLLFSEGQTFLDILLLDVSYHEIYLRSVTIGFFLIFGVIIANNMDKRIEAEEKVTEQNEELQASNEEFESLNEELREAHEELQETNKKLGKERDLAQKYLDTAGVMMVAINRHQDITLINPRGCEILGYSEDEALGRNWFDNFLPEAMRDDVKVIFDRLMAGDIEPVEYYENPVLTRSGEERTIAWHNALLMDSRGQISGTLSSGEDITERKRAEDALRKAHDELEEKVKERTAEVEEQKEELSAANQELTAVNEELIATQEELHRLNKDLENTVEERAWEVLESEKKYRSLFNSTIDGIALHEVVYGEDNKAVDFIIMDVNPKFVSILGIDKDEAIGKKASELYGTGGAPYLDIYSGVAETREPTYFETYFPPMDKHFSISVFSPGKGKFATVFQDITDRKRLEEEKLEAMDKVIQQMKDHEEYVLEVADRLRNPLQVLKSALEIINSKDISLKQKKELIEDIHKSSSDLEEGIKKLT